jgi:CIC family chloride channel protein
MCTTSFSIGSGGSGGVFGPSIVIGGALGGAVGLLMQQLFPGMAIQVGAFVIVGMAGFFAAAANTPISTVIMVSEMTGNYHLLVPSMWVCTANDGWRRTKKKR